MVKAKKGQGVSLAGLGTGLVVGGAVVGIGSSVIGGTASGSIAASGQAGLTTVASFLPTVATIGGSFIVVRQLQGLQAQVEQQTKARRRRAI